MKSSWNLTSNVFARGFLFFGWLVFQNFILTAYSTSKDSRLQKLLPEKILTIIHTLLNTYFNPLYQVILVTIEKVRIDLVANENQILFTAEPDFP